MEALSALAAVAQGCIPAYAQETAQKAILQADLERTRLEYERSRMVSEDNRQKYINGTDALRTAQADAQYFRVRMFEYIEEVEDLEAVERDNEQYIEHLRDKKRNLKQKYENLCDETDKQYHSVCFLEHTTPNDTERNDRQKFMRLFKSH